MKRNFSTDTLFQKITISDINNLVSIFFGNNVFVAVSSDSNKITFSTNSVDWTVSTISGIGGLNAICYGDKFVAVGNTVAVYSSTFDPITGFTWTVVTGLPSSLTSVCYGNGLYVAVSSSGPVTTSPDGITWTTRTTAANNSWQTITYGDGLFVALASSSATQSGTQRLMSSGTYSCYHPNTNILCFVDNEEQYVNIQKIKEGTYVKTLLNGYVKVSKIGKIRCTISEAQKNVDRMFKHKQNELMVTGWHFILVDELPNKLLENGFYKRNMIIDGKKILLVCDCDDFEMITECVKEDLYHLVLESDDDFRQYGIYANGVLTESCSMDNYVKKGFA